MKKFLTLLAAGLVASVLSACGSQPTTTTPPVTTAQVVAAAAKFCPLVNTDLSTLQAMGVFTGGAATTLTKQIQPDVEAFCSTLSGSPTIASADELFDTTLPAIVTAIENSSLSATDKTIAIGGIGILQGIIVAVLPDDTVTAAPATAPVAASPVLVAGQ